MGDYGGLFCHAVKKDRLDFQVVVGEEGEAMSEEKCTFMKQEGKEGASKLEMPREQHV